MRLAVMAAASFGAAVLATSVVGAQVQNTTTTLNPRDLRPVASFGGIADKTERSRALFNEVAKVITSPRCMNCHPAGDSPLQANDQHVHMPPILRGENGLGVAGVACSACHTEKNFTLVGTGASYKSIPGHPRWQLAPIEMAWEGKTLTQICQQIKDPARNGGKTMDELVEHMAHDSLVGWGWNPGAGREPVPGSQDVFGELIRRWAADGAACPPA